MYRPLLVCMLCVPIIALGALFGSLLFDVWGKPGWLLGYAGGLVVAVLAFDLIFRRKTKS